MNRVRGRCVRVQVVIVNINVNVNVSVNTNVDVFVNTIEDVFVNTNIENRRQKLGLHGIYPLCGRGVGTMVK